MKTIFGVSSVAPLNKKLKNGYTLHDWIKRKNCFPAFCLRTLTGQDAITQEEIDFLHQKDCKVGLVIRDLTEAQVSSNNGDGGVVERAVEAAKALGIPQNAGITLFVEINPMWSVNHNWMLSFAHNLVMNGYLPGFIGNTDSSKNFNFDRQVGHYVQATEEANGFSTVYGATEPKLDDVPGEWKPYCPSDLNPQDISLWVCGTITFDAEFVENVYAHDENVLNHMWYGGAQE